MSRKVIATFALAMVVAAGLLGLGRWETHHFESVEASHIRAIWADVASRKPTFYRIAAPFDCLGYGTKRARYAVEVCFDGRGRMIQAIDRRRPPTSKLWSLSFDPGAAPISIQPSRLIKRFQRLGVLRKYGNASYLPSPHADEGPTLVRRHHSG